MVIFSISEQKIESFKKFLSLLPWFDIVLIFSIALCFVAVNVSLWNNVMVAYGDTQSHLNIPKRVVDSITPGFAQLGGVWLPLPHLLMIPFVKIEFLYRSGLAGAIVSGAAFVITCAYIYKLALFLTKNQFASFLAFFVFATNPNILYLQTTALTEAVLICFFVLSTYYFIQFLVIALKNHHSKLHEKERDREYLYLIFAALFAFCASLSRYDGWFLVGVEAIVIVIVYLPLHRYLQVVKESKFKGLYILLKEKFFLLENGIFHKIQGMTVLFSVLAFLGIFLWLLWDGLILGDPLYFTNSTYSAKSQQQVWKARGELPAYHNLNLAFQYYFFDSMANIGVIIFTVAIIGLFIYLYKNRKLFSYLLVLILFVPFIFNVLTLFIGQSVIFIPHITPSHFEWKIFNVRYGILMLPAAALFYALLFYYAKLRLKLLLLFLILLQFGLYASGYSKIISITDAVDGLSASKTTDADYWMKKQYDDGLVLMDDFARSINIIESNIPMNNIIYIGNKPYWPESMKEPEKYAKWIVLQKNDEVWKNIYEKPEIQARLYKYFVKTYTSPDVLIFKRNENVL